MSDKYYYLVASLPYLRFGRTAPTSSEEFLSECGKWLSPEDMKEMRLARLARYSSSGEEKGVLNEWKAFDRALREAVAAIRSGEKASGERIQETAKAIMDQETPLLREKLFEETRWDFLDGKEASYFFDVNRLVIYYLKLQILERLDIFDKDKGEKIFYDACEVTI